MSSLMDVFRRLLEMSKKLADMAFSSFIFLDLVDFFYSAEFLESILALFIHFEFVRLFQTLLHILIIYL